MGRLENFIPQLSKCRITPDKDDFTLEFPGQTPIPVSPDVAAFVKQANGHLSLKEIFLFLNGKGLYISINRCLGFLHRLAEKELLSNSKDYFHLLSSTGAPSPSLPSLRPEDRSYFSRERLIALVQKTTLFMSCDRSTAEELLRHATLEFVKSGKKLIASGSRSSDFFVVLTGGVDVLWKNEHLATLGPLSVFGESAAVFDRARNADVVTCQPTWILRVNASQLVDTTSPESFDSFKGLQSRLILNQTLSANPLFKNLPADIMQFFISKCRLEKWGREQTVIEQDETSGDFYFILQGSVSIIKDGIPVTSLAEGDHFGEVAALFNEPRTASVITETSCTLLALNNRHLFEILASHFRLAIDMENTAMTRKTSSENVLEIFHGSDEDENNSEEHLDLDELSGTDFKIDKEFLEVSHSHFDLEVIDFSTDDDQAS